MSMQNDKSKQYVSGESIDGEFLVHKVFGGAGKSGMGVVYLVTSRNYPEPFVIKTSQASNDSFFFPKLQLQVEHFGKMAATSGCIKVVEKCIE